MGKIRITALVATVMACGLVSAHAAAPQGPVPSIGAGGVSPPAGMSGGSGLDLKGLPEADTAIYAQGLHEHPDGWHFVYGPVHSDKNKSAIYAAKGRNGSVVIACGSTGNVEMIFGLAGAHTETGQDDISTFSVGEKSHELKVRAAKNPPNAVETVYYATGMDVLGILRAMASLDLPDQLPGVVNISIKDRRLSLPSPWPVGNAKEMLSLCSAWNNRHIISLH